MNFAHRKARAEEIARIFWDYRSESNDEKRRMQQIAMIADGDVVIPLPELGAIDKPAVANLTHVGIQGLSQRFASVQPDVDFLPYKTTAAERTDAELRTRVVNHWWAEDKAPLLDAQSGRFMFGYGSSPRRVDWHLEAGRPFISLPSPLATYAPRPKQVNDLVPAHGISARLMSVESVKERWGDRPDVMLHTKDATYGKEYWVLEYADAEEIHLVLCGEAPFEAQYQVEAVVGAALSLEHVPNLAGVSPWVVPGLIHLNRPQGHFDQLVGMYQANGLLTALELQQAARSVFQETWVVARPGEIPNVVTNADPITGQVGVLEGGDIRTIAPDAQFHTHMTQDRLTEAQRTTASIPADFSGQAASNVRTGRRAPQLQQAAIDPTLSEAQTTFALAKQEEVRIAAEFDKVYGGKSKTFVMNWRGRYSEDTYEPAKLWEKGAKCLVSYPIHGVDANGLMVLIGQAQGLGHLSRRKGMKLSPLVDDVEGELDLITSEQLQDAFLQSIATQVADPASPMQPRHWAQLIKMTRDKGLDLVDAYVKLQEQVQKEQSEAVPAGGPEAMPGLDGAGALPPPVSGPAEGTQNLASLMGALRMPNMQVTTPGGSRV